MGWNIIPLMFSNLIGQILPGIIILILACFTIIGPNAAMKALLDQDIQSRIFSIGPAVAILFVSQSIGMLFGQMWTSTIGKLIWKAEKRIRKRKLLERLSEHNCMLKALHCIELSASVDDLPEAFVMRDHLHLSAPKEAARLLKVRAERRLCHAIAFGAILIAIFNLYFCIQTPSMERFVWEIILLVTAISSSIRSFRLVGFLTNGTVATWLCLASAEQLEFQKNKQRGNTKPTENEN